MKKRAAFPVVVAMLVIACGDDTATTDGGTDSSLPDTSTNDVTINDTGGGDTSVTDGSSGDATSTDAATDATSGGDSGGAGTIKCGNTSCPLPTQACCVNGNNA